MADISYNPTTWVDNQTPVNQSAMNNIEQGIVNATTQINTNTAAIATNTTNIAKNSSDIADLQAGGGTDMASVQNFLNGKTSPFGASIKKDGSTIYSTQNENIVTSSTSAQTTYTLVNIAGAGNISCMLAKSVMSNASSVVGNKEVKVQITIDGGQESGGCLLSADLYVNSTETQNRDNGVTGVFSPLWVRTKTISTTNKNIYFGYESSKIREVEVEDFGSNTFDLYNSLIVYNGERGNNARFANRLSYEAGKILCGVVIPNRVEFTTSLKVEVIVTPISGSSIQPVYVDYKYEKY